MRANLRGTGLDGWSDAWLRGGWRARRHASGRCRLEWPDGRWSPPDGGSDLLGACIARGREMAPPIRSGHAAILLHGLYRRPGVMSKVEEALCGAGLETANAAYASARLGFDAIAAGVLGIARGLREDGATRIDLVGHSLGGLVARSAAHLAMEAGLPVGSLVLIGSPARGAAMARTLRPLTGPCRDVLVPGVRDVPHVGRPTLVIAGGTGRTIGFNPLLKGDNDGAVGVAETSVPEARTVLVRSLHTPLAWHPQTVDATLRFLLSGHEDPRS